VPSHAMKAGTRIPVSVPWRNGETSMSRPTLLILKEVEREDLTFGVEGLGNGRRQNF
jgi:hypothetical protein